jgi:hypothetical protein
MVRLHPNIVRDMPVSRSRTNNAHRLRFVAGRGTVACACRLIGSRRACFRELPHKLGKARPDQPLMLAG